MVYENNCQNESVTTKHFDSNGYKNLFMYMVYLTNGLGIPTVSQHMHIPRNLKIFQWCTRTIAKMKVVQEKLLILMGTRP